MWSSNKKEDGTIRYRGKHTYICEYKAIKGVRSSIYQEGVDTVYIKDEWRVVYIKREWGAAIYIKEEWDQFISRGSGSKIYQEGMRDSIYQGVGSSIYQGVGSNIY